MQGCTMADEQSPPDVSIAGDVKGDLNVAGHDIVQQNTIINRLPWTIWISGLVVLLGGLIAVFVFLNEITFLHYI